MAVARDAATLVAVRDAPAGGVEVFCVERHKTGFLGGAIVFPGGKLDTDDLSPAWDALANAPRTPGVPWANDEATARGLAVAACRESLEEAAILPVVGPARTRAELVAWRRLLPSTPLRELLAEKRATLDLASLHPFARWITPVAEPRRYDTRFFAYVAGGGVGGAHDDHETTASFWATPAEVLARFVARQLQLAPPTHRMLTILAGARDAADAIAIADAACHAPICPRLVVEGGARFLALPGDPAHDVADVRVRGPTRFVLRGDRFMPVHAP